jgi:hypothetical protein
MEKAVLTTLSGRSILSTPRRHSSYPAAGSIPVVAGTWLNSSSSST